MQCKQTKKNIVELSSPSKKTMNNKLSNARCKISTTHPARPAAAVCNKQKKINLPIKQSKNKINKPKYPVANLIIIIITCA